MADLSTAPGAAERRLRVLHLVGSPTSDFHADLSRLYATDCLEQLAGDDRDETHVAYVTPDALWRFPVADGGSAATTDEIPPRGALLAAVGAAAPQGRDTTIPAASALSPEALAAAEPVPVAVAVAHVASLGIDLMVPQMFCLAGMTAYRALFDVLGIPYVGNAPEVMALTADKARARAVVAAAGIDVPEGELVRAGGSPSIPPPAVVKPVDADNSVGVALVRDAADYDAAITVALEHSPAALVETYVPLGREVRCGVVERGGELVCLPLEEYRVGDVRTAVDKIVRHDDGDLRLMAKDAETAWIVGEGDPIVAPVHELARRAYVALGCRHYGLFDVRVDPDGRPWFLEASLYCSFARQSVLCVMARATGVGPRELFESMRAETRAR